MVELSVHHSRTFSFLLWIILLSCTGFGIITFFNPANNTEVVYTAETENVTFECIVSDDRDGSQGVTQWFILNFRGVENSVSILTVLPDTILEGESTNGTSIFDTFRTQLTFPEFLGDFHLATLMCGFQAIDPTNVRYPLRVYGTCLLCKVLGI